MNRIASVVWLLQNSSALNLKATSDPYSASNSLTHKKIVTIWIKKLRIFFSVNARKCSNAHTHWLSFPIFWSIGQLLLYCAATADRVIGGWASALFFSAVQRNKKIRSLSRTFFWHKKKSVALHTHCKHRQSWKILFCCHEKIQFILKRVHFLKRAAQQTADCQLTNVCYYFWSIEYRAVHRNHAAAAFHI